MKNDFETNLTNQRIFLYQLFGPRNLTGRDGVGQVNNPLHGVEWPSYISGNHFVNPMAAVEIQELDPRKCSSKILEEIVRLEKKIFPKHESLSKSFYEELKKKSSGLIFAQLRGGGGGEEIVGYAMYSWISSLCASITKLAGDNNKSFEI